MSAKFLISVLGSDGASALLKAAERRPILECVLVPRTIIAWIGSAVRVNYEGEIPGVENSYISLTKGEHPDRFKGAIAVGDVVHTFEHADILHVAAAMGIVLGVNGQKIDPLLKGQDLSKLGKSIDLLVAAKVYAKRFADESLQKRVLDPSAGYKISHDASQGAGRSEIYAHAPDGSHVGIATFLHHPSGHIEPLVVSVDDEHQRKGLASAMYAHAEKVTGKKIKPAGMQTPEGAALWQGNQSQPQFGKEEMHGLSAPPNDPDEPIKPVGQMKQQQIPRNGKNPLAKREIRVSKSESERKCSECGGRQFYQKRFVGCLCSSELAKSTKTEVFPDGNFSVRLVGSEWDEDSLATLLSVLKR